MQMHFKCLRQAFLNAPESREIAIAFHESALATQKIPAAAAAFRKALSVRQLDRRLRFFLIDLLLRQNSYSEAITEIETALADFGIDDGTLAAALKVRECLGPLCIAQKANHFGSVSLCMIVKNEEKHLARCLRSAKPVVDEIVVVDTGSTDETQKIAVVFGARVYAFPWVNDFSKARNFALSKAVGDWILVMDADEALSARDYINFRKVLEASRGQPVAYRIQTRNYSNQVNTVGFRVNCGEYPEEKGMGWYPSDKVRLFPKDPRIRFEYPVHELVEPSLRKIRIPISECGFPVHHYGTLNEIKTVQKTERYKQLGNKKLQLCLKNPAALKEAAIQSARTGNHSEAMELWRRFIKLQPQSAEAYLNIGTACWSLGNYEEAAVNAQEALGLDPSLKEARFNLAFAVLMAGRAEEAQEHLEELLRRHPDYPAAQFLLCVIYACLKDKVQAEGLFNKLRTLPIAEFLGESFLDIAKRFLSASLNNYAHRTLEAALLFGCESAELRTLFQISCATV
jgi:tetratricopeptide (TPR) repeat protein